MSASTPSASSLLAALVRREAPQRAITAVCSAHPLVLEAALRRGARLGRAVLVEATCNQVNQEGGYTGQTPEQFRAALLAAAERCGLPRERLLLGGDHLGPNPWTALPAVEAMRRAEAMVTAYAAAGFGKLHLDASMACADDPPVLPVEVIAARATALAVVAEETVGRLGLPLPLYVIGTEVPPPGGARERLTRVAPTPPERAEETLEAHARAFSAADLGRIGERVIGLVVQPGVEFGNENVVAYDPVAAAPLAGVLARHAGLAFEAHSTDYQPPAALAALARDGFAILKVGPWLTFALREGLYALAALATELGVVPEGPRLAETMEQAMLAEPRHWQGHCGADPARQRLLRHYGYSDRIRYYWATPGARGAVTALLAALGESDLPEGVVSQFFPHLAAQVRAGTLAPRAPALLEAGVEAVLAAYGAAEGRA